ncbi:MAG TPA: VWA domain-containing protein [Bryobacteraceae bacterium]|nr:VWA domain-containing protein [Bryobacteraceae bacterium]HOL71663.1 VWA domain-containing protein [Bryobacteraceae bacterium]HOQ45061.1 VWA domain-containing protein [Bryobacteraceae bacterium]HPQ15558.1 VWA domain-containing protein [Bryobacteraceae bacterium]HPU71133.1 VWA domain-containing protein [Bryobacteraceae bacterium]
MKIALILAVSLCAGLFTLTAQQGPRKEGSETVAKPRSKKSEPAETPEGPKIPSRFGKKDQQLPEGVPSFRSDVTTVTVDVAVLDNKGQFIPNIPREYFRILEDNVPQQIKEFSQGEAPMTVAMVIEFSNLWQSYWTETWYQTLTAAYGFLETLKPEDYVAVVAFDLRTEILSDFSQDKREAYEAMRRLQIAAYSESNMYDAVAETAQRMSDIEGRKAIVLIASGYDTFSKLTFDKTRKILQEAGVPIYAIGIGEAIRQWYDAHGYMGPIARLDALQANNALRTFAKETGGMAFIPRFYGEFPAIFQAISDALRRQYVLTYNPTNQARDGKFRKIKVELVNPATGEPLRITDQKNKPIKYQIIAKNGYTAPREVE